MTFHPLKRLIVAMTMAGLSLRPAETTEEDLALALPLLKGSASVEEQPRRRTQRGAVMASPQEVPGVKLNVAKLKLWDDRLCQILPNPTALGSRNSDNLLRELSPRSVSAPRISFKS